MGWIRDPKFGGRLGGLMVLAGALLALAQTASMGQGVYAIISNSEITAGLGESGADPGGNATGRFFVFDNKTRSILLYGPTQDLVGVSTLVPVPGSALVVRIDNGNQPPGQVVDPNWKGWDFIVGEAPGQWLLPPTVLNNRIIARWSTVPGSTTNPVPPIQVNIEVTLIHDMASYRFTLINGIRDTIPPIPASGAHTVGLRFSQNFKQNTQAFINEGPVFLSTGEQVCGEFAVSGALVPAFWRTITDNPDFLPYKIGTAGDLIRPLGSGVDFLVPDRLIFGSGLLVPDAALTNGEMYDHTPVAIPGFNFCKDPWDAASAIFWSPRLLPTGDTIGTLLGTYFGRNFATIIFDRTWATGTEAPFSLKFTPTPGQGLDKQVTPNPFTIGAFAHNLNALALSQVTASINLPQGLELVTGEQATKQTTNVQPNTEASFTWSVKANGAATGVLTYHVSFSADPGGLGSTVSRQIEVPALPVQTIKGGKIQMVSFPYSFDDPTPSVALGLPNFAFDLVRWNTAGGFYQAVDTIRPSEGYWLLLQSDKTITLQGAHPVTPNGDTFESRIQPGWTQIGNPFLFGIRWGDVQVVNTDIGDPDYLKPLSIAQASDASHMWILPTIWSWDTDTEMSVFDQDFDTVLTPFVGYWVYALKPNISLLFPKPVNRSVRRTRAASPASRPTARDWKLRLVATSGGKTDGWNFIGVSPAANDGYDAKDVLKAPAPSGYATVGILRSNWSGRAAGVYAQDIQSSSGGRKSWDIVVTSPKPSTDVTLSWPEVSALGRGYELYITDKATGQRRAMRQTSSLRVNTGEGASRAFAITAEPRGVTGTFRITDLQVRPTGNRGAGGGAAISFVASTDANIQVRILGSTGQPIRTLVTRAAPSGASQLTWDYKDARGVSIPSGVYTIEVKGTTTDGQQSRAIAPHLVAR